MERATALTVFQPQGRTLSMITRLCCDEALSLRFRIDATFSTSEKQSLLTELSLKQQEIDESATVARSIFTVHEGGRK